ncbi:hypothetical protein BDR03DRAFT_972578 [Suillus americanus]|nr:hypothetical protein BDR03DRAFT_972578 [Suillus americanus]
MSPSRRLKIPEMVGVAALATLTCSLTSLYRASSCLIDSIRWAFVFFHYGVRLRTADLRLQTSPIGPSSSHSSLLGTTFLSCKWSVYHESRCSNATNLNVCWAPGQPED